MGADFMEGFTMPMGCPVSLTVEYIYDLTVNPHSRSSTKLQLKELLIPKQHSKRLV